MILGNYSSIVISISGGKDSQTILGVVLSMVKQLSCAICVLATDNDIRNGASECPDLAEHYLRIESEYGHTFRHKKSLYEILNAGVQK